MFRYRHQLRLQNRHRLQLVRRRVRRSNFLAIKLIRFYSEPLNYNYQSTFNGLQAVALFQAAQEMHKDKWLEWHERELRDAQQKAVQDSLNFRLRCTHVVNGLESKRLILQVQLLKLRVELSPYRTPELKSSATCRCSASDWL